MSLVGRRIGEHRLDDFVPVAQAAEEVGVIPQTIKRWLRNQTVPNVVWGRDARNWIFIHRESVPLLKAYKNRISLENR